MTSRAMIGTISLCDTRLNPIAFNDSGGSMSDSLSDGSGSSPVEFIGRKRRLSLADHIQTTVNWDDLPKVHELPIAFTDENTGHVKRCTSCAVRNKAQWFSVQSDWGTDWNTALLCLKCARSKLLISDIFSHARYRMAIWKDEVSHV
jgi:hypothetical protein